jgi:hypothetical protein
MSEGRACYAHSEGHVYRARSIAWIVRGRPADPTSGSLSPVVPVKRDGSSNGRTRQAGPFAGKIVFVVHIDSSARYLLVIICKSR